MKHCNNILRYSIKLISENEEYGYRHFCMEYNLGTDKMLILQIPHKNSGFIKGRFMASIRLRKPGYDIEENMFYGPKDFVIGK